MLLRHVRNDSDAILFPRVRGDVEGMTAISPDKAAGTRAPFVRLWSNDLSKPSGARRSVAMSCHISKIWYNAANAAYEGRVDIKRNGRLFRYPCSVEGPMDMAPTAVRAKMIKQAFSMSDTPPESFSVR